LQVPLRRRECFGATSLLIGPKRLLDCAVGRQCVFRYGTQLDTGMIRCWCFDQHDRTTSSRAHRSDLGPFSDVLPAMSCRLSPPITGSAVAINALWAKGLHTPDWWNIGTILKKWTHSALFGQCIPSFYFYGHRFPPHPRAGCLRERADALGHLSGAASLRSVRSGKLYKYLFRPLGRYRMSRSINLP